MLRIDDLNENGLVLLQDTDYPCFSEDSILLLRFAHMGSRDRVVDLGSGTGVLSVLGQAWYGSAFHGIEIQPELVDLARRSAERNGQTLTFSCMNVQDAARTLGAGCFTKAIMNPPYFTQGDRSSHSSRAMARHTDSTGVADFIRAAAELLISKGVLFLCYPATELTALFDLLMKNALMPKRMQFVATGEGRKPYLVLLEAKKHAKHGLLVEPQLTLEKGKGS